MRPQKRTLGQSSIPAQKRDRTSKADTFETVFFGRIFDPTFRRFRMVHIHFYEVIQKAEIDVKTDDVILAVTDTLRGHLVEECE